MILPTELDAKYGTYYEIGVESPHFGAIYVSLPRLERSTWLDNNPNLINEVRELARSRGLPLVIIDENANLETVE